jgi:hypothetical protein
VIGPRPDLRRRRPRQRHSRSKRHRPCHAGRHDRPSRHGACAVTPAPGVMGGRHRAFPVGNGATARRTAQPLQDSRRRRHGGRSSGRSAPLVYWSRPGSRPQRTPVPVRG